MQTELEHDISLLFCFVQEKELKNFHEQQKSEMKLLKHEVDVMPKEKRKETMKRLKEEKEIEQAEAVWWTK